MKVYAIESFKDLQTLIRAVQRGETNELKSVTQDIIWQRLAGNINDSVDRRYLYAKRRMGVALSSMSALLGLDQMHSDARNHQLGHGPHGIGSGQSQIPIFPLDRVAFSCGVAGRRATRPNESYAMLGDRRK